jgi:predicted DNA-binding transcriptional regulator AlpA
MSKDSLHVHATCNNKRRAMTSEDNHILTVEEAAKFLGLSVSTLNKRRVTGELPKFIKLTARRVGYEPSSLQEYIASCRRSSTSDKGGGK